MKCGEAQEILWPPEQLRVADHMVVEARRHVESCRDCQRLLARDRLLRDRIRAIPLPPAPPRVRERVFSALAEERHRRDPRTEAAEGDGRRRAGPGRLFPWSTLRSLGAAAAVAALLMGGWFLLDDRGSSGTGPVAHPDVLPGIQLVEDFVREAVEAERIVTSDPAEVTEFLHRELGMRLSPLTFDGFQLVGAEICIWEEKRGAVILYVRNGQMLYHYVVEGEDPSFRSPRLSGSAPARWSGETPPSVAVWSSGLREEALVGSLSPASLLAVVNEAWESRFGPPS